MRLAFVAILSLLVGDRLNAAPGQATTAIVVRATVIKPITLKAVQDLNFGTITPAGGTWTGQMVRLSQSGVRTCDSKLVCTGAAQVAKYRVAGSNKETIGINAPNVRLTNQSDSSKSLMMTVDSPGSVILTNSGNQGQEFSLGGSIMLDSSTADGVYSGTFNVTVEYR